MLDTYKSMLPKFDYTDFGVLCDDIVGGIDFTPIKILNQPTKINKIPSILLTLEDKLKIKITSKTVIQRYKSIAADRASHGQGLHPRWVVLQGSRGAGFANHESDYDLLILHSRGVIRQFHTPYDTEEQIEFEYSDLGKFEQIANFPFINPIQGPLELVDRSLNNIS